MEELIGSDYRNWLNEIKQKLHASQIKASVAVNGVLIGFYWDLGRMIAEKQAQANWGNRLFKQLSHDLKLEFVI
ncbi:MAG: DUF1016 family protein [Sphingobacteriaceae bacterium]|nr:MAG: DUF1016 family protein [Sphingobacteriaceae bacterium]